MPPSLAPMTRGVAMSLRSDGQRDVTALLDEVIAAPANLLDGEPLEDVDGEPLEDAA